LGLSRDFQTVQAENKRAEAKKTKNKTHINHDKKGSEILGLLINKDYKLENLLRRKNFVCFKKRISIVRENFFDSLFLLVIRNFELYYDLSYLQTFKTHLFLRRRI